MGIRSSSRIAPGFMSDYGGGTVPAGWLLCDGSAVSRATYAALFLAIGTAHGAGDGSTTFNVPDSRGRTTYGKDDMGGTAANRLTSAGSGMNGAVLGASGGAEVVTLTKAQIAAHGHTLRTRAENSVGGNGSVLRNGNGTSAVIDDSVIQNEGLSQAHSNVSPGLVVNKLIKY